MGRAGKDKEPQTVEEFVSRAPLNMLACRTLMHQWSEDRGSVEVSGGHYFWEIPCGRCPTVKVLEISATGRLVLTKYRYPPGYQIHVGGKMDKYDLALIRLSVVKEYM